MCDSKTSLVVTFLVFTIIFGLLLLVSIPGTAVYWILYKRAPDAANILSLASLPLNRSEVPIPRGYIAGESVKQSLALVHNGLTYNIAVRLLDSAGKEFAQGVFKRASGTPGATFSIRDEFPFLANGTDKVQVSCPLPPTNITTELDIEPECQNPSGAPTALDGKYERIDLGEVVFKDMSGDMILDFSQLEVTVNEGTPQVYFVSYGESNKDKLHTGAIVFTVLLPISFVGLVVFLLVCLLIGAIPHG